MSQKYSDLSQDVQDVFAHFVNFPFQGVDDKLGQDLTILFRMFQQDEITAAEFSDNLTRVMKND